MSEKLNQKALKGPDQFQEKAIVIFDWILKQKRQLGALVAGVIIVMAVGLGWQAMSTHLASKRLDALGALEAQYDKESEAAQKQREAIQKQIEALAEVPAAKDAAGKEIKKPEAKPAEDPAVAAKKKALEKQRDDLKPDHTVSLEKYRAFATEHAGKTEGWFAGIRAAGILMEQKKEAEARPLVEKVAQESLNDKFYQVQSRLFLVGLKEDAGEYDAALKDLDVLSGLVDDEFKPKVLLAKGRIQYFKDAKPEAKTTLSELVEKHSSSPEAQKARGILGLIN